MADKNFGHDENKNLVNLDQWVRQYMSESQTDVSELKQKVENMWSTIYPVGSIYLSTSATNPGNIWGGTWVAWGSGRVPVGINTGDSNFNTVEKVGGSKELQGHNHTWVGYLGMRSMSDGNDPIWSRNSGSSNCAVTSGGTSTAKTLSSTSTSKSSYNITIGGTTSNAGTGSSGNLQPYIVCYMWKRTA